MHSTAVKRSRLVLQSLLMVATVCTAAGCGGGDPQRFDVSGRVAFRGQPVPAGTIIFEPDAMKGNDGPQGVAAIANGVFNTAQGGRGTVGGPHMVTILGCDGVNITETSPQGQPLFEPFITSVDLPTKTAQLDFHVRSGDNGL